MQTALVHDWLNQAGGAESVLETFHGMYPQAPIYTSMYEPRRLPPAYRQWDIRTSFMQRLPGVAGHHQALSSPLPPGLRAARSLGLRPGHLQRQRLLQGGPHPARRRAPVLLPDAHALSVDVPRVRGARGPGSAAARGPAAGDPAAAGWDRAAADRVTAFAAISVAVQERIRQFYGRESEIIYPPVADVRLPAGWSNRSRETTS